jgi:hypothetical protein
MAAAAAALGRNVHGLFNVKQLADAPFRCADRTAAAPNFSKKAAFFAKLFQTFPWRDPEISST